MGRIWPIQSMASLWKLPTSDGQEKLGGWLSLFQRTLWGEIEDGFFFLQLHSKPTYSSMDFFMLPLFLSGV